MPKRMDNGRNIPWEYNPSLSFQCSCPVLCRDREPAEKLMVWLKVATFIIYSCTYPGNSAIIGKRADDNVMTCVRVHHVYCVMYISFTLSPSATFPFSCHNGKLCRNLDILFSLFSHLKAKM